MLGQARHLCQAIRPPIHRRKRRLQTFQSRAFCGGTCIAVISIAVALAVGIGIIYTERNVILFGLLCGTQIVDTKISPDKRYVAQETIVDCGATTDYSTRVNLKDQMTGNEMSVLSVKGDKSKSCDVVWDSPVSLSIKCQPNIELFIPTKVNLRM
jgi:hypothetical protein